MVTCVRSQKGSLVVAKEQSFITLYKMLVKLCKEGVNVVEGTSSDLCKEGVDQSPFMLDIPLFECK